MTRSVRSGLEVLLADGSLLAGKRIGLVTNPTGVDGRLRSAVDLLRSNGRMQLVALFAPEHGIRGEAQAGALIADTVDQRSGLPVHSLYGATRKPTPAALAELDALVFDIQDVGARFATYISTLALVLEAAADVGTLAVVLDRPNPLNGVDVEGGSLAEGFASFVGMYAAPIRHGLTMGERARLFAVERGLPRPTIVAMEGWKRELWFDETGLPWVQPSPNLPTLDAVTLYPGTCLVEGTSVSEGRGTTRPFELVGAPWIDPFALAEDLGPRRTSQTSSDGVLTYFSIGKEGLGATQPHTSRAVSTMSSSFAFCSSAVIALPSTVDEKPHCPLRQSCSNGTYLVACSILRLRSSFFSSAPRLVVTRPRTTTFPFGTKRSGSNVPDRASSYSRKKPSTPRRPKTDSAT